MTQFILVLGNRFGWPTESGKSATEIEYDQAYKQDPTKVLVFQKEFDEQNDKSQNEFISKVTDYYSGFWRTTFTDITVLQELVSKSFYNWLIEKSSIGKELTYIDHFIRLANKHKPEPNTQLIYRITPTDVELEYTYFGETIIIHITRKSIYENFWGQVSKLQTKLQNLS
ncbi:DUF4062 domain-containing protein [Pontibacter diazotrophicus]|uniref:DUF4062 domain-containing protein n=1 Tax=Pontibacter diazotrophicus TaxID=1400979 RepID=A0A3D8L1T9_9BACT|nr:DUF4062 domain-containing protein [Pontibacter diazotrophicus]RDV11323.1 DUF4062 domain-containing protein [Pontibacter diazotrophicus]